MNCEKCNGFYAFGDSFYFIDDKKIVTVFYRSVERGYLIESATLYAKSKERKHFSFVPFS